MNQKREVFPFWRATTTTAWRVVFFLFLFIAIFGVFDQANAAIKPIVSGRVFSDLNVDGKMNIGEFGLEGWHILAIQNGKIIQSAVSDSQGYYEINLTANASYSLQIEERPGWENVTQRSILLNPKDNGSINQDFGLYQSLTEISGWSPIIKVSDVKVEVLSPTSAKVTWFSSHLTAGQIVYGFKSLNSQSMSISAIDFGYDYSSTADFCSKTYHSIILNNLKPNRQYYFRAISYPDVNQWRNAQFVISDEFGFSTPQLDPKEIGDKEFEEIGDKETDNKIGSSIKKYPGQVLSVELDESEIAELLSETNDTQNDLQASQEVLTAKGCFWSIVILLFLNALAIIATWFIGQKSQSELEKKIWWVNLILVVVPTILAFPECWLNFWLGLTLIFSLGYLSVKRKDIAKILSQRKADSSKNQEKQ